MRKIYTTSYAQRIENEKSKQELLAIKQETEKTKQEIELLKNQIMDTRK